MFRALLRWAKVGLVFAIGWLLSGMAVVTVMSFTGADRDHPHPLWSLAILTISILGGVFAVRGFPRGNRRAWGKLQKRDLAFIHEQVERHRPALERNLRRAMVVNDYGAVSSDTRYEAVEEFLASVNFTPHGREMDRAVEEVLKNVEFARQERNLGGFDASAVPVVGHQFEDWVADSLAKYGWETSVTPAGGDQGIDVVATRFGLKVGIQCKLYSQPVGNGAVQEAIAGAKYYGLHRAAVLSNASFTKSAKELAAAAEVILLAPEDIPNLESQMFRNRRRS